MTAYRTFYNSAWLLASVLLASSAVAQPYPVKPIRIVVPSTPGTPPDVISRIIANEISTAQGWRVFVENRPGGSQTVGAGEVLRQDPDGYSVLAVSLPLSAIPAILPNVGFRLESDFVAVAQLSRSANALVVHPSVPANSVPELVGFLRREPNKYTFSSGGFGTPGHLIGELFKLKTGVQTTFVPYQQFPQMLGDLLNGTNQYMFTSTLAVSELVHAGKLRALATTGRNRSTALPEVPTLAEQGFSDLVVEDWVGFAVKRGTPHQIVVALNQALNKALGTEIVRDAFAKLGAEPVGGTAEVFHELLKSQIARWGAVVREAGIKLNQ